jgi:hypothetical protein
LGRKLVDSNLEMTYAPAMPVRRRIARPSRRRRAVGSDRRAPLNAITNSAAVVQLQQIGGAIKGSEHLKVRHCIQITLDEFQVL